MFLQTENDALSQLLAGPVPKCDRMLSNFDRICCFRNTVLVTLSGVMSPDPSNAAISQIEIMLRSALETVLSPERAATALEAALGSAGLRSIPAGGRALRSFVRAHLEQAVSGELGLEQAELFSTQLAPMIRSVPTLFPESATEAKRPYSDPEESGVRDARERIPVFVATSSDDRFNDVANMFKAANVIRIHDVVELLERIPGSGHAHVPRLIVDCEEVAVHPVTLATVADDFDQDLIVLLWGAEPSTASQIRGILNEAHRWIRCDRGVEDLLRVLAVLL